jgi:lipopolysaccharide transport system ATP-binding protein
VNGAILGMKRTEIERKFDETCAERGRSIVAFSETCTERSRSIERFLDTPVKRYSSGTPLARTPGLRGGRASGAGDLS